MTVSSSTDRATFVGNNVAQIFPLPFRFFDNSEIEAWLVTNATGALSPLTLGTHYTLSGAGDPEEDGSPVSELTMLAAPTALQSLLVQRVIPITQPTDIVNQGRFLPEIHENVFDRLTMLIQQAAGESKGAIRVAVGDPEPARLAPAVSRANQLLGFDSNGNPVAVAPISGSSSELALNLLNTDDPAKGPALVGYNKDLEYPEGSVGRNLNYRMEAIEILPTGSDQTAELVAYLTALGASYKGTLFLPYGIKFDRKQVTAAIPVGVVIFDISQYANDSPGETNKSVGFMSSDVAENDTHFTVTSGHHAIQYFNNYATSGTTSADERKASVLWGAGNFENNPDKKGPRAILAAQFTKESGLDYWIYTIRSLAPWLAAHAEYEDWATGEAVGIGVYRRNASNHYISTTAGTTGATAPTHTTGTVSDGAVSWQWVDSAFRTMYMIDQYGRVAFNAGTNVAQMNHKTQTTDPLGPNNSHHQRATGISGDVFWRPFPTDASSVEQAQPYVRSSALSGTRWVTAAGGVLFALDNAGHVRFSRAQAVDWSTAADGDTTPSVLAVSTLRLNNTGATSITALDDAIDGQRVTVVATNANSTLVHSSTLMLSGSVNVALTAFSSVTFERVPNSISARWIEVGRSIK